MQENSDGRVGSTRNLPSIWTTTALLKSVWCLFLNSGVVNWSWFRSISAVSTVQLPIYPSLICWQAALYVFLEQPAHNLQEYEWGKKGPCPPNIWDLSSSYWLLLLNTEVQTEGGRPLFQDACILSGWSNFKKI